MNVPAPIKLPAHLQALTAKSRGSISSGIIGGMAFHAIGIAQSRWRLFDPQGGENVVPALHLDVIILAGNPHGVSKRFYSKAYDKDAAAAAPDCFSDNGVSPSVRSAHPQCATCAACPHNVWGSKITQSGKQTKACADSKLLAVLLAENPTGPVYQLPVPAASLRNLQAFDQSLQRVSVEAFHMVVRLTFDSSADYPLIVFTPLDWANPEQAAATLEVLDTDEVDRVINKNDVPIDPARVGAAATSVIAAQSQPAASLLAPQGAAQPESTLPKAVKVSGATPVKRTRRTKAEIEAANAPAVVSAPIAAPLAQSAAPSAASFFNTLQTAAAPDPQINVNPQPTTSALDDLIANAMAK